MKKLTYAITLLAVICVVAANTARAQVQALKVAGKVEFSKAGAGWKALAKGGTLSEGDMIRTGANGEAILRWFDGNTVKLSALTELTVKKISGAAGQKTALRLDKGRVLVHSKKLAAGDEFTVETPIARAGVRGTDFTAAHETMPAEKSTFEVIEGSILVDAQEVQKLISSDFFTTVDAGQPPLEPMELPDESLSSLEQEVRQVQQDLEQTESQATPPEALEHMADVAQTMTQEILQQDAENLIMENLLTPADDCCNY